MGKLAKRLPSGAVAILAVVLPAFLFPSLGICVLLTAIATVGILEFYGLLELTGTKAFRGLGVFFGALLIIGTWLSLALKDGVRWDPESLLLTMLVIAVFLRLFPQKNNGQPVSAAAGTVLGVIYISFLFNYFTKLAFRWEPTGWLGPVGGTGRMLFFYLLAVVKTSDIAAYVTGTRWGRHKLIPRISPGKTWEGSAGGLVFGLAGSLVFFVVCGGQFGLLAMTAFDAVILGLLLPIAGLAGDLSESILKRAAGVKDSGVLAPGLGGVLDIVDSLLFAVPVLYYYAVHALIPTT